MAFAILRVAKVKGGGGLGGCADHIERTRETPNAGPGGIRYLVGGDPAEEVRSRLPAKVRKNAVVAMEHLLTASPEYFRPHDPKAAGQWNEMRTEIWAKRAVDWLKQQHGDNLASAVLHLDEATPHIHALVVPRRQDGKLDAATLYTPNVLRRMQDSYANAMAPLGLERGIKGSTARHEDIKDYYGRVNGTAPAPQPVPPPPKKLPPKKLAERVPWTSAAAQRSRREREQAEQERLRQQRIAELQAAWDAVSAKAQETERLNKRLAELQATMEKLQRDSVQIQRLPLPDVAQRLGVDVTVTAEQWQWRGLAGRGAVSLVQAALTCDRHDALAWLASQYGESVLAAELVAEAVEQAAAAAAAAAAAPRAAPQPSPSPTDAREVARWPWVAELTRRGVRVYAARLGGEGELIAVALGDNGNGAEVLDSTGSLVRRVIADRLPDPVTVTTGEPPVYTLAVSTAAAAAAAAADAERHGEAVRVISLGGLTRDQAEEVLRREAARVILALDDEDRRLARRLEQRLDSRCGGIMPPPPALTPPEPPVPVAEAPRPIPRM